MKLMNNRYKALPRRYRYAADEDYRPEMIFVWAGGCIATAFLALAIWYFVF